MTNSKQNTLHTGVMNGIVKYRGKTAGMVISIKSITARTVRAVIPWEQEAKFLYN